MVIDWQHPQGVTLIQQKQQIRIQLKKTDNYMFHLLSLVGKWQSYYDMNSKNYYYQKNYFIFKLPKKRKTLKK